MTFLCELCCPSARQTKLKTEPRKSSRETKDERKRLNTFLVPDSFVAPDGDGEDARPPIDDADGVPETSFYYKKGAEPPMGKEPSQEDEQKKLLKEIKKIAKRIEGPVQKHPKSGRGLFKKVQDRYVAIVPDDELDVPHVTDLMRWKAGTLSWWESLDACKSSGTAPKGFVPLLKIAKVDISKDDKTGKSVVVKHKFNHEMHELVLIFPTKRDAEEWSYALWEFISVIRGQSTSVH